MAGVAESFTSYVGQPLEENKDTLIPTMGYMCIFYIRTVVIPST